MRDGEKRQKAAIYARVSTDQQGESVPHQVALLQEIARARGLGECLAEFVYEDEGISASKYSIWTRPAMRRLLNDAKAGKFQVVMFKGISRFARSTQEALDVLDRLKTQGLQVISYEENYDSAKENSNFIFTMHAAIAEYEAEKIGVRVRLGNKAKAQKGGWCGSPPDGYKLVDGRLVVDESRRPVIQKIFGLYQEGLGSFKIAELLNNQGIVTSTERLWSAKTIRDILTNQAYIGRSVYNRTRQTRVRDYNHPEEGKKKWVRKENPPEEWVVVDQTHEPIIGSQAFAAVQKLLLRKRFRKEAPRAYHPLTGILICGKCGQGMVCQKRAGPRKSYRYYICKTYHKYGRNYCSQTNLRAAEIEREVAEKLEKRLRSGFNTLSISTLLAFSGQDNDVLALRCEKIRRQIGKLNRKTEALFLQRAQMTEEQYRYVFDRLKKESQILNDEYRKLQAEPGKDADQEKIKQDILTNIDQFLTIKAHSETEMRRVLHKFIDKVVVDGSNLDIFYRFRI